MRPFLVISTIFILTSCGNINTAKEFHFSGEDTLEIGKILNKQRTDWNNGDIDGYMKGYEHSDTLKFITKNGVRMGYDSISARYKRSYDSREKMGHLDFNDLRYWPISLKPLIYQVTGKWKISGNDSANGNFSLLVRRNDGAWKIIVDHTW